MGLFRRRKTVDGQDNETHASATEVGSLNEEVQDVMKDNLELMKEVVMKIREDPEFAKNIYKKCPRLQHLLDQYPDLRPIFEDPKLVRINFEQVYRDAGGVLPEDEEKKKSWLVWLVNSPFFKVLKVLLFVKKLISCIAGGGVAFMAGCFMGCCFEDALDELDGDQDADADADGDGAMNANKEALHRAAEHMEDPEVQEQMQQLLDNPENLDEAIENDHELSALRDSNPLCEELMSDPDTCRILTDPDNLRALGEAPELIELDFADPDGFVPDVETGGLEGGYDAFDGGTADMEIDTGLDAQFEIDANAADDGFDAGDADGGDGGDADGEGQGGEEEGEGEDDGGWWEDAELEEQEAPDADADNNNTNNANKGKAQAKGQAKQAAQQAAEEGVEGEGQGKFGGIMASIGVCAADLIAGQIVGSIFGDDILPGGGGMGDDIGGVVDDDVVDAVDETGDAADVAEDTMDEVDEKKEGADDGSVDSNGNRKDGANAGAIAGGTAGGAAAGGAAGVAIGGSGKREAGDDAEGEEDDDKFEDELPPKKSRFGFLGTVASSVMTAAKEQIVGSILGEDFGEELVERWEEGGDKKKEDEDEDEGEGDGDGEEENDGEETKKRGFFRRR